MKRIALLTILASLSGVALGQLLPSVNFTFNNTLTDMVVGTDAEVWNTGGGPGGSQVTAQYVDNVIMPDSTVDTVLSLNQHDMVRIAHQIAPNGGGSFVNEYSILIDLKIPDNDEWVSLYQTNPNNLNDGEFFVRDTDDLFGVIGDYQGTPLNRADWNRIVLTVRKHPNFTTALILETYVNGFSVRNPMVLFNSVDDRWALEPIVYLLGDDNGEMPSSAMIANAAMFDGALSASQIRDLGGASATPVPEPTTLIASGVGILALMRRRRK